jgi:hypothetical protein
LTVLGQSAAVRIGFPSYRRNSSVRDSGLTLSSPASRSAS